MEKIRNLKSAVCKAGHLQTSTLEKDEHFEKNFCTECSLKIIDSCDLCQEPIIGGHIREKGDFDLMVPLREGNVVEESLVIPNYCHSCGRAYPWVQKFLDEYKLILELQSEEINEDLQKKIYSATEEALKNKFKGNSLVILKLMFNKLNHTSQTVMFSVLSNVATTQIIEVLKS